MKNQRIFIFILVITLALGLAACTRSASQPSTSGDENNPPAEAMETPEPMSLLEEMATQTAIAKEAGAKAVDPETGEEATSTEGETTEGETTEGETTEGETTAESGQEATTEGSTEDETEEAGGGQEPVVEAKDYEVPDSYTLKSGEFPYCIARRFNINPIDLLSANGLGVNAQVYPGTNLTIPKDAGAFDGNRSLRNHPTDYTVLAGDSIYSIACLFGDVDPRAIEDVNGLGSGATLSAGQVIKIP